MMKKSILILTSLLSFDCMSLNHAFMVPTKSANYHRQIQLHAVETGETSSFDSFLDDLKMRLRIFQESNASGSSFKQSVANVLAGEYDEDQIKTEVDELINSAPCVMFTWEKSPSCVKAVEAFDMMGVDCKIIRLDDPWSKGNPIRATLGKKIGRTSVPFIFVGGKYVGGYDGGLDDGAPGIVNMAFQGTLRSALTESGALKV